MPIVLHILIGFEPRRVWACPDLSPIRFRTLWLPRNSIEKTFLRNPIHRQPSGLLAEDLGALHIEFRATEGKPLQKAKQPRTGCFARDCAVICSPDLI